MDDDLKDNLIMDFEKSDSTWFGGFLKGIFILLFLMCVFYGVMVVAEDVMYTGPSSWDVMENVTFKEISYDSRYHENRYFIFTDEYCFDVDLNVYNKINVGDKVNLTVDKYNNVVLKYGEHRYGKE